MVEPKGRSGANSYPVRYAVVGAGHIAQNAVLPAFANANEECRLTAIFSDDPKKRRDLGDQYGVECFDYGDFDRVCRHDLFDAVYICVPNSLHREYTERAAEAGIHVLCEKPLAVTARDCEAMIRACQRGGVLLMTAYRLHFEESNMHAVEVCRSGKLGEVRAFSSTFTMQVRGGNIRTQADKGGGPMYDIGVYCVNAARYLFRDNPIEVSAMETVSNDPRFRQVPEALGVTLRFPGERLATFYCSFGAADSEAYRVIGTKGNLEASPTYGYASPLKHVLTIDGRKRERTFLKVDQFAPEIIHFARCIRSGRNPQPDGLEGLIDVAIVEAAHESARTGRVIGLELPDATSYPDQRLVMKLPAHRKKRLVDVAAPSK